MFEMRRRMLNNVNGGGKMRAIDLGLPSGTLWAECNLGAENPEDDGLYYFWGDPVGHVKDSGYSFSAANFNTLDAASLTGDFPATAQYDAAVAALGQPYRVPTPAMINEMVGNCNRTQVKINGKNAYKFTSKINGKYIILPFSGNYNGTTLNTYNQIGFIWSNGYIDSNNKRGFRIDQRDTWGGYFVNNRGNSIRPVYDPSL